MLTPGIWVTTGDHAFIPGLAVTLPGEWSSRESDRGEFKLIAADHPNDVMFIWKDVVAIQSNGETPRC